MAIERSRTTTMGRERSARTTRAAIGAVVAFLLSAAPSPAGALDLELSGQVTLRPQGNTRALGTTQKTILLADDVLRSTARVTAASEAERKAITLVVLQRQHATTKAWHDVHTFYRDTSGTAKGQSGLKGPLPAPSLERRVSFPASFSYSTSDFSLPFDTSALRASARRGDGTSVESLPLLLEVRRPPAVLTLLAQGGACFVAEGDTNHKTLTEAGIIRNAEACASKGVQATYLGDLTPMASVNCNNPCNANCMNFLEHLALRLMNDRNLATRFDSIDNPGERLCQPSRTNPKGISNRIVFGKWRNTDEEWVCPTPKRFNALIDDFVKEGGKSLILIGQSQGGAKFADMVRDHWRWGNAVKVELFVSWDASSFTGVPTFVANTPCRGSVLGEPCTSMGTRSVGARPLRVLNFFQYHDPVPFQNGAPIEQADERHDLNVCFSHNAIARSQFVHHKTADAVQRALDAVRDRARSAD